MSYLLKILEAAHHGIFFQKVNNYLQTGNLDNKAKLTIFRLQVPMNHFNWSLIM